MKTIKGFLVMFVLLITQVVSAQTGEGENWIEVRGICQEEGRELIEISVSPEVSEVVIIPSDPQALAINWFPGEAKTRRFWIDDSSSWLYVAAFYGGGGERYELGNVTACEDGNVPSISVEPGHECLGIPLVDFINMIGFTPSDTGFIVDGLFYNFHDTLSFVVAEDDYWTWDMYVDGLHVASFEQTAEMLCTVTAIYPQ